jgi:hypothetical protein
VILEDRIRSDFFQKKCPYLYRSQQYELNAKTKVLLSDIMNINMFIVSEKQELSEMCRDKVTLVGNITDKIFVPNKQNTLLLFCVFPLFQISLSLNKSQILIYI